MRDLALRSCSLSSRGLWADLLCLMWDGSPRGFLRVNGRVLAADDIALLVGAPSRAVKGALEELERNGVASRSAEDGALYSRRMVRDEETAEKRRVGGEAGAEHGPKGAGHGHKGGRPRLEKPPSKPPSDVSEGGIRKPPPASASASASVSSLFPALNGSDLSANGVVGPSDRRALLREELEWRVAEVWRVHLVARQRHYAGKNGKVPPAPILTTETSKAIRAALREHDRDLMGDGEEGRKRWSRESPVRAAGIGIFLSDWHTGTADNAPRAYLEPWRPWKPQRGKGDPVPTFAQLYFEERGRG